MGKRSVVPILAALFLAEIASTFETAMVYASMRALIQQFGDPITVGWLVTIYLLVAAGSAAVAGRLGDLYGRRRVVLVMLFAAAFGSALSGISSNFALVLLGRALQGLAAAILPLCLGILREHLSEKQLPIGVGFVISAASAGIATGLVFGGMIVDVFNWRAVFFAGAALGTASMLGVYFLVPVSGSPQLSQKQDIWGAVLFVLAISSGLLALSKGAKDWGWDDSRVWVFLILSVVLFLLWIRHSLRQENPLLDVRLFANPRIAGANILTMLMALSGLQITYFAAMLLQAPAWTGVGLGLSATVAGLVKLPSSISACFAGPTSGWISSRYGSRRALLIGGLIVVLGWIILTIRHDNMYVIGATLCFISIGTAIMVTAASNVVVAAAPTDRTSEASGMLVVVRSCFSAVGAQVIAILAVTSTISRPGQGEFADQFAITLTMGVLTFISLAAVAFSFLVPKRTADNAAQEKFIPQTGGVNP